MRCVLALGVYIEKLSTVEIVLPVLSSTKSVRVGVQLDSPEGSFDANEVAVSHFLIRSVAFCSATMIVSILPA